MKKFSEGLRQNSIKTLKNNKAIIKEPMLSPLTYGLPRKKTFQMNLNDGQSQWFLQKDFIKDWVDGLS